MTSRRILKPFVWSIPFAEEQLKATAEGMMSYNKWIVRVTITYPDDHPSPTHQQIHVQKKTIQTK